MSRGDKMALAAAVVVSLMGVSFTQSLAYDLYFGQMPVGTLMIAVVGWAIARYGLIIIAVLSWRLAKQFSASWLIHILLLPSFYGLLLAGNALMLSTLDVSDFDDTLGAPVMPALFVIIAATIVYFSARSARQGRKLAGR